MVMPNSSIIPELAPSKTATSLLLASASARRLSSSCASLDALLTPPGDVATHGLARSAVLELMGPPGIGKTRTAMGFVLSERFRAVGEVRTHEGESRSDGEVLVVDAEGSLSPSILWESAELYASHNGHDTETVIAVCDGIHHRRVYEASLLVAFLYSLPSWLADHRGVTLIVLDSLTSHLRPTSTAQAVRSHILSLLKSTLHTITSQFNVSVILSSYLSLKLYSPEGYATGYTPSAEALLVPQARADLWMPFDRGVECRRIVMYYDEHGERCASIVDSTAESRASLAEFTMDALGPCDHPPPES